MSTLDEAKAIFARAEAIEHGQFAAALDLFADLIVHPEVDLAFHGSPGPESLPALHFNMAVCHAHRGDWPTARKHIAEGNLDLAGFEVTMELRGAPAPPAEESPRPRLSG